MLLKEAGYEIKNGVLTNTKTGQPLTVEFLLVSPLFERIVQPYLRNLEQLGIKGTHPHGGLARNIRGGSTASTTTSSSAISPSPTLPATSSAISGARRPRAAKAAAT